MFPPKFIQDRCRSFGCSACGFQLQFVLNLSNDCLIRLDKGSSIVVELAKVGFADIAFPQAVAQAINLTLCPVRGRKHRFASRKNLVSVAALNRTPAPE